MPKIDTFPSLKFEEETIFNKKIEELFDKVKHVNLAYKAKEILYLLCENYKSLFIRGGANYIWSHHNENGEMFNVRIAIINFD